MGGYGSGSRNRWASKTVEFHKLDLAKFKRNSFDGLMTGQITWSRGGRQTGCIGYHCTARDLRLIYTVGRGEKKHDIDERFDFRFTDQPFGGQRRWLVCKCGRRCRVLYGAQYFRCRQCHGATYESQYETFRVSGLAKAEKVRERLGMQAGIGNAFGPKPKGMHWRTYRRLREADWKAVEGMDRLLSRCW